jgi:uncharacterized protein YxjI
MKSSYELAMERLNAKDPDGIKKLSDKQKKQMADVETKYKAKIAEREVFLRQTLEIERGSGNHAEAEKIATQLRSERAVLEEEMESEKEEIRKSV